MDLLGFGDNKSRKNSKQRWFWRSMVALALVMFGLLAALMLVRDASWQVIETETGEVDRTQVGRGSSAVIEGQARLRYVDPEATWVLNRPAELEAGTAVFDIVEADHGFIVETEMAHLIVMEAPARFSVEIDGEWATVSVERGRVAVAPRERQQAGMMVDAAESVEVHAGHIQYEGNRDERIPSDPR